MIWMTPRGHVSCYIRAPLISFFLGGGTSPCRRGWSAAHILPRGSPRGTDLPGHPLAVPDKPWRRSGGVRCCRSLEGANSSFVLIGIAVAVALEERLF